MKKPSSSVLVVLVARNGARWLPQVLKAIARQKHRRLAIVAVDNASTDGSAAILEQTLGPDRVVGLRENVGFAAAVAQAMRSQMAQHADYLLLLHGDVLLSPDALAHLLEAADEIEGVGIIGPKVRDWDRPRVLLEVGGGADRFGFPYPVLEEGEIDHGQHDGRRETLFVSFTAMLVARGVWQKIGPPDERIQGAHAGLDYCWRARMAGFRVVAEPRALVLHHQAGERGERPVHGPQGERYVVERAALAALLKNYRLVTLAWLLPLFVAQGIVRVVAFLLSARASAGQILAAWWWNITHLPGTLSRRTRAQIVRTVPDRAITRFMASAVSRLRRWMLQGSALLVGNRAGPLEPDEEEVQPFRTRLSGLISAHPVALAWIVALLVWLIAFREVLFGSPLVGGALPTFPRKTAEFFSEFFSGWRGTGFGGNGAASPALLALGGGSVLAFGNPDLLARLLVAVAPLAAAATCYRVLFRRVGLRAAAIAGAAAYALSALPMWAASEGQIGVLILLIGLPWLAGRVWEGFERLPDRPIQWVVGTAAALAAVGAFFPGVWIPVAMVTLVELVAPGRKGARGLGAGLAFGALVTAAVLVFPFAAHLIGAGGPPTSLGGIPPVGHLLRFAPGPAPGSWFPALFLPLAALVAFPFVADRRSAWKLSVLAGASPLLAWIAAAGYLPQWASDPISFLAVGVFALAALVAGGVRAITPGVDRHAFGYRQLGFAALVLIVGGGIVLQGAQAIRGRWSVGRDRISPAYPVVATDAPGAPFRVLWLGNSRTARFPPPGGPPDRVVGAGDSSVAYSVTGRRGESVLSTGLRLAGPAAGHLDRAIRAVLESRIEHGGSLLAPFGIRFVVTAEGGLPNPAERRLDRQVDLLLVQRVEGLVIYRNAVTLPVAGAVRGMATTDAAGSDDLLAPTRVRGQRTPFRMPGPGRWEGRADVPSGGLVFLSTEFDRRWEGTDAGEPFPAFGWAVGFEASSGVRDVAIDYRGGPIRVLESAGLAVVWALTAGILRPRRRAARRGGAESVRVRETVPQEVGAP